MNPRNSEPQSTVPVWAAEVVVVVVVGVVAVAGVDVVVTLEVIEELGVTDVVDTTVWVTVFDEPQPARASAPTSSAT
jgi:hypothetical protein